MSGFDKSKPFGTVWGGDFHGRFIQGGKMFDHEGNELEAAAAPAVAAAEAVVETAAAAPSGLMIQAMQLLEQAQGKVVAELEDLPDELLHVAHEIEAAVKKRAGVIEAILATKTARVEQATKDAQANGLTPSQAGIPTDQVSAQLNA